MRGLTKIVAGGALAALGLVGAVERADALSIRMSYGGTIVTLADGQAGSPADTDALAATVQYEEGTAGNGFFGALGFSEVDVIGSRCTVCPSRLTLTVEAARTAAATQDFIVEVSDVGFTTGGPTWLAESDFTSIINDVSGTFETYVDASNTLFGTGTLVHSDVLTGTQAEDFESLIGALASPYSMMIRITYAGTTWPGGTEGSVFSQANLRTSAVPVPAALPLMVGALGVFGLVRARRRAA